MPASFISGTRYRSMKKLVTIQMAIWVSPTPPTPSTLPARSVEGRTLDITTSATRDCFSSITPRRTFCPYIMMVMYSRIPTTDANRRFIRADPPRPVRVTRSDLRPPRNRFTRSASTVEMPARLSSSPISSRDTAFSMRRMSLSAVALMPA